MGFRNLQAFNKALLAKQLWRILQNPNTLVARVLRARYFPTGDILNVNIGNSPSYSWKSIHSSLKVIRKGTRWRVGNGKLIHVWDDKWLPTPTTYKIISPPNNIPLFPMVSSLIDPMTKWWNVSTIRASFLPFEVETILKIPLSHDLPEDKIIWIGNNRGNFTVKSAYHLALNLLDSDGNEECSTGDPCKLIWRKLWRLNLHPKIKIFAWRACINSLPTMEAINHRGISHSMICPVCKNEAKSIDHALLDSVFSSSVWNLWLEKPLSSHGIKLSFLDSSIFVLSHATLQISELFFTFAWTIWFNRNKVAHEGCGLTPNQVWQLANSSVENYVCSSLWDFGQPGAPPTCWVPPPHSFHKINVDGASSDLKNSSSFGVVIRDSFGQVVAALSKPLHACFTAEISEMMALV